MTTQPRIHGRYRVDERLGATRIATVYRVYDDKLHRPVLLNLMRSHLVEQRGLRERFIADSELRARNVHSALPEVYDSGTIEDRPFFITEFITGQVLRASLPLTPLIALQYLKQIIGVVHACQQSHIPHPPISSNDFVVVSEGHVKWIENWQLTPSEALIDIASYRAPERKEGSAETDQSIVYAIGVLLFELISGTRPFIYDTPEDTADAHATTDIPPVSTVMAERCPPQVEELIMRCTARNPAYRIHDCTELLDIVAQVRRELLIEANLPVNTTPIDEGGDAPTVAATYQTNRSPRNWKPLIMGSGVLVAIVVVAVLFGPQLVNGIRNGTLLSGISDSSSTLLPQKIIMPAWLDSLISGNPQTEAQILIVNGDTKLALHSDPDEQSSILVEIGAGSRVTWIDGPQTADGTAWMQVSYTNTIDNITITGWRPTTPDVSPYTLVARSLDAHRSHAQTSAGLATDGLGHRRWYVCREWYCIIQASISGPWAHYDVRDLATPQAYARNPKLVWQWYNFRRSLVEQAEPSAAHHALVDLEQRIPEFLLVSLAIDGLHWRAGSRDIVELNGCVRRTRCVENGHLGDWDEEGDIPPRCQRCGSPLRPDVVLLGEGFVRGDVTKAKSAVERCDTIVFLGEISANDPVAQFPFIAQRAGACIITIAPDDSIFSVMATHVIATNPGAVVPDLVAQL